MRKSAKLITYTQSVVHTGAVGASEAKAAKGIIMKPFITNFISYDY